MEKQDKIWEKDLIVLRYGTNFRVWWDEPRALATREVFTDVFHAKQFIRNLKNTLIDKQRKKMRRDFAKLIKDNPNLRIRQRKWRYKELCQQIPDYI